MPTHTVRIEWHICYDVEVEADDETQAEVEASRVASLDDAIRQNQDQFFPAIEHVETHDD